jgi:hypothetical protein
MQYQKPLRLALVPSIVFLLLSVVSVALTTHYWILGDWIVPRGVRVVTNDFDERTQTYRTDFTIVWFIDKETDATIASGCLCLSAAIMALIAWSTLRKPGMDTQLAAVCWQQPVRNSLFSPTDDGSLGQTPILGSCSHRHDHSGRRRRPRIASSALHRKGQRPVWLQIGNIDDERQTEYQQVLYTRDGLVRILTQVPHRQQPGKCGHRM